MGQTRNYTKWISVFCLPFILLFFSHSPLLGKWTSITTPTVSDWWYLNGVHFTSADEGWAVGSDQPLYPKGVLLHYQNGNWSSVAPPAISEWWSLYGVHFTSADKGWAVGTDEIYPKGVLLHYQNGNWTSVAPPDAGTNWSLYGVHFISADEGWAVGSDEIKSKGVLLHYQNGNWTSVTRPDAGTDWSLNGVHFTSADEGWAVGSDQPENNSNGVLLHFSSIRLLNPNGGGSPLPTGSNYLIKWKASSSEATNFTLMYSLNNGVTWKLIEKCITGLSTDWAVPFVTKNKTNCLVKVEEFNDNGKKLGSDKSDGTFTIDVAKLTSPNGGESLSSGSDTTITWDTYATVDPVSQAQILYSLDKGVTWKAFTSQPSSNTGSHQVTLPPVTRTKQNCKVKVVLKDASGKKVGSDTSDGVFTINP